MSSPEQGNSETRQPLTVRRAFYQFHISHRRTHAHCALADIRFKKDNEQICNIGEDGRGACFVLSPIWLVSRKRKRPLESLGLIGLFPPHSNYTERGEGHCHIILKLQITKKNKVSRFGILLHGVVLQSRSWNNSWLFHWGGWGMSRLPLSYFRPQRQMFLVKQACFKPFFCVF